MRSSLWLCGLCASAVVLLAGCIVDTSPPTGTSGGTAPPPVASTGSVTLTWTVSGAARPVSCTLFNADELEVILYDPSGREITRQRGPCSSFSLTVTLPLGTYQGEARLLDRRGRPVSTVLRLSDIRIVGGTDLTIDVDFPSNSRI